MTNRPYVTLNVAMTLDGKTDTIARHGAHISSTPDWDRVDRLRAASDAVMVGGHTLLGDDPRLIVKSAVLRNERLARGAEENPMKVAIVTTANLRPDCRFLTAGPARIMIFTTSQTSEAAIKALRARGVQVSVTPGTRVDLPAAIDQLGDAGVQSVLVEGGGTLNEALLRDGLIDEISVFIAPLLFGGANAPTFVNGPGLEREAAIALERTGIQLYDDGGIVVRYHVKRIKPDLQTRIHEGENTYAVKSSRYQGNTR